MCQVLCKMLEDSVDEIDIISMRELNFRGYLPEVMQSVSAKPEAILFAHSQALPQRLHVN